MLLPRDTGATVPVLTFGLLTAVSHGSRGPGRSDPGRRARWDPAATTPARAWHCTRTHGGCYRKRVGGRGAKLLSWVHCGLVSVGHPTNLGLQTQTTTFSSLLVPAFAKGEQTDPPVVPGQVTCQGRRGAGQHWHQRRRAGCHTSWHATVNNPNLCCRSGCPRRGRQS
jgi:hypothetical protein